MIIGTRRRLASIAVVVGLLAAPPAVAEELVSDAWQFSVTPYLWALAMEGDVTVKGVESQPSVSFKEILDNLDYALMVSADGRKGRIGGFADAIYAKLSDTSNTDVARIKAEVDQVIVEGGAYYRLGPWNLDPDAGSSGPKVVVDPYAGLRYTYLNVDLDLRDIGQKAGGDKEWIDPIVGLRTLWEITPRWNVNVTGDIGGFGISGSSDFSWQALGTIGYRFGLFGEDNANVRVGYRALHQKYRDGNGDDEFEWDMTLHGPVIGLAISF